MAVETVRVRVVVAAEVVSSKGVDAVLPVSKEVEAAQAREGSSELKVQNGLKTNPIS